MEENNSKIPVFLKGIVFGIVIMLAITFIFSGFKTLYKQKTTEALDPKEKIEEIYSLLDEYYVNKYDKEKMTETMYQGMVYGVGDPYTSYMDSKTLDSFLEQTNGTYAGVGIIISASEEDNKIAILTVFEDSPGAKSGLKPGDKIIKVNDIDVYGDSYEEALAIMKGRPGTTVNLTVFRESEGSTFDVDVEREKINVPTVFTKMFDNNIGYLRISNFDGVTLDQFKEGYEELQDQEMKGLIIDVRNNPGGLLDVVADISDILIPKGYSVYTENKTGQREYFYSDESKIEIPLAILVNGNSASASEVLSGAVKDTGVGILVGEQTFGKGLVQKIFPLEDGSGVKVTIAKYYTPNGICIDGEGIAPDYMVKMDKDKALKISELELESDEQLLKAVEVVSQQINK